MSVILILTLICIIGAAFVSLGKPLAANVLWIVSNPLMAIYNFKLSEYEMSVMFAVYSAIAIYGIWNLKYRKRKEIINK